jgi:hypothetical protein
VLPNYRETPLLFQRAASDRRRSKLKAGVEADPALMPRHAPVPGRWSAPPTELALAPQCEGYSQKGDYETDEEDELTQGRVPKDF